MKLWWFYAFWRRYFDSTVPSPVAVKPAPTPAPVPPVTGSGGTGTSPPVVVTGTPAPLSLVAFAQIAEPPRSSPAAIVRAVAGANFDKIDATGWVGLTDATGRLDISRAKHLGIVMLHGLAWGDAAYVDRALLGIKGVMSNQGADGSFPSQDFGEAKKQHSFHHKTIVLADMAQALLAVRDSSFYIGARRDLIDGLIAQIGVSAVWCAGSADMVAFFKDTTGCANQMLSAIVFLHAAGVLADNPTLQSEALSKIEWLFANMVSADGAFLEQGGFDTVYQLFSMRLLAGYVMMQSHDGWRDACTNRLRAGFQRWVQIIDPLTGMVDTSASSRTTVSPTLEPGKIDTWDNAATGYSLYLGGYVCGPAGFAVPLDILAARQIAAGQTYEHQEA